MKYNFAVDTAKIVEDNSNSQFATIEFDLCRSGMNTHRLPMTRDSINLAIPSVSGKPILASFDALNTDFRGHESDEVPVGFFDDNCTTIEKDNELYLRATGKVWKRYFPNVMDIFRKKQGKTDVSVEIECLDFTEATPFEDGRIDVFSLTGITLLGVNPAIRGAEARVLSFSEIVDEYEKEQNKSQLEEFSQQRAILMSKTYRVNKTELKATTWGNIDKTALRNKIMDASNKSTLVKDVYALVEKGWETSPSEHLKYPIMELVGDTFYYNRGALASALAYAKQEHEQTVIDKIEQLYKKFNLKMEDGEETDMAEINEKDILTNAEVEPQTEEIEKFEENEAMTDEVMEDSAVMEDTPTDESDKKDEEDGEGDDEKAEEFEETEMSSFAKTLKAIIDCSTAEERMACMQAAHCADEDENIVMQSVAEMCGKMADLESFQAKELEEKTKFAVNDILATVKTRLSTEDFAEISKQAESVKFEDIESFEAQVKAFAFDHMKVETMSEEDGIVRMGIVSNTEEHKAKNVFERILEG